jgi:hypothetical protein
MLQRRQTGAKLGCPSEIGPKSTREAGGSRDREVLDHLAVPYQQQVVVDRDRAPAFRRRVWASANATRTHHSVGVRVYLDPWRRPAAHEPACQPSLRDPGTTPCARARRSTSVRPRAASSPARCSAQWATMAASVRTRRAAPQSLTFSRAIGPPAHRAPRRNVGSGTRVRGVSL